MKFPKTVLICRLSDGTPITETVYSEEELERHYEQMEEIREALRRHLEQYPP